MSVLLVCIVKLQVSGQRETLWKETKWRVEKWLLGKVLAIHSVNCSLDHGNPRESKAGLTVYL